MNKLVNDSARRIAVEQTGLQVLAAEDEDDDLLILAVSDRVGMGNVLAEPVFHIGVAAVGPRIVMVERLSILCEAMVVRKS